MALLGVSTHLFTVKSVDPTTHRITGACSGMRTSGLRTITVMAWILPGLQLIQSRLKRSSTDLDSVQPFRTGRGGVSKAVVCQRRTSRKPPEACVVVAPRS